MTENNQQYTRKEFLQFLLGASVGAFVPNLVETVAPRQKVDQESDEVLSDISLSAGEGETVLEQVGGEVIDIPCIIEFTVNELPSSGDGAVLVKVSFSNFKDVEELKDLGLEDYPIESLTFRIMQENIETVIVDAVHGGNYAVPLTSFEVPTAGAFELHIRKINTSDQVFGKKTAEYKLILQKEGSDFPLLFIPLNIEESGVIYMPNGVRLELGIESNQKSGKTVLVDFTEISLSQ